MTSKATSSAKQVSTTNSQATRAFHCSSQERPKATSGTSSASSSSSGRERRRYGKLRMLARINDLEQQVAFFRSLVDVLSADNAKHKEQLCKSDLHIAQLKAVITNLQEEFEDEEEQLPKGLFRLFQDEVRDVEVQTQAIANVCTGEAYGLATGTVNEKDSSDAVQTAAALACEAASQTHALSSTPPSSPAPPLPPSPPPFTTLRLHSTNDPATCATLGPPRSSLVIPHPPSLPPRTPPSPPSHSVYHPEHHPYTVGEGRGPPTGPLTLSSCYGDALEILHSPPPPPALHPTSLVQLTTLPTTPSRDTDSLTRPTPPPTALARDTTPTISAAPPALNTSSTPPPISSYLAPTSPTTLPAFLPVSFTTHTDCDIPTPSPTIIYKRDDGSSHMTSISTWPLTHPPITSTDDLSLCFPSSSPSSSQRLPAWTSFPSATGPFDSLTPSPSNPILYLPDANVHLVPQTWVSQRLHRALALLTTSSFLTRLYISAARHPRPSFSHTAATPARSSAATPAGVTTTPLMTSPATAPFPFSLSRLQDVKLVSSSPHSPRPSSSPSTSSTLLSSPTSRSETTTARPAATSAAPTAHNQQLLRTLGNAPARISQTCPASTTGSEGGRPSSCFTNDVGAPLDISAGAQEIRLTERGSLAASTPTYAPGDMSRESYESDVAYSLGDTLLQSRSTGPLDDTTVFLQNIDRHCDELLAQVPDQYPVGSGIDDAACQQCGPLPQHLPRPFAFNAGATPFTPARLVDLCAELASTEADTVLAALGITTPVSSGAAGTASAEEPHATLRMELDAHGRNADEMKAAMQEVHTSLQTQDIHGVDHKGGNISDMAITEPRAHTIPVTPRTPWFVPETQAASAPHDDEVAQLSIHEQSLVAALRHLQTLEPGTLQFSKQFEVVQRLQALFD